MHFFIETVGMIGDKFFRIAGSMFHWVSLERIVILCVVSMALILCTTKNHRKSSFEGKYRDDSTRNSFVPKH